MNTIEAAINEDPPTEPTLPADNPDVPPQQPPTEPTQTPAADESMHIKAQQGSKRTGGVAFKSQVQRMNLPADGKLFDMGAATLRVATKDRRHERATQSLKPAPTYASVANSQRPAITTPLVALLRRKSLNNNETPLAVGSPSPARRRKEDEPIDTPSVKSNLFPERDEWNDWEENDKEDNHEAGASATNDNSNDASSAAS